MKKTPLVLSLVLGIAEVARSQPWLDQIDEALYVASPNGLFRSDLSGLLDLEGYYVDQRPGSLIVPDDDFFFNPRLSLFLDTRLGTHLYSFVQARFDRGFDPGAKRDGDARFDEYLIRYTPWDRPVVNLQVGKFATVVGNWVPRHLSWDNPFINAPLPYENILAITDHTVPGSAAGFLGRRDRTDDKPNWLPLIWGPSYATGGSIFGSVQRFDYGVELKNASLSSRPATWDAREVGFDSPTLSGRVGFRPNAAWTLGVSASGGSYLLPAVRSVGVDPDDYQQWTVAHDVSYAHGHWELWGEVFFSRFEVPNVGDADTLAYYLEAKYKLTTQLFLAGRWNQQFFGTVRDGAGGSAQWDHQTWRADGAVGYRFTRHLQAKAQYSYTHQQAHLQQGEQLAAVQLTLKF